MLTDTIVEEEFELKEEEPWYDKQDLEHGTVCWGSLSFSSLAEERLLGAIDDMGFVGEGGEISSAAADMCFWPVSGFSGSEAP